MVRPMVTQREDDEIEVQRHAVFPCETLTTALALQVGDNVICTEPNGVFTYKVGLHLK